MNPKFFKDLAQAISLTEMSPANRAKLALETGEVIERSFSGFNLDKWVEACDGKSSSRSWITGIPRIRQSSVQKPQLSESSPS